MSSTRRTRVSLYDLLGVEADASAEEIKKAWREATDDYEPGTGSGQFRMYNEAADILLDPARRADYDAELEDKGAASAPAATTASAPVESTPPKLEKSKAAKKAAEPTASQTVESGSSPSDGAEASEAPGVAGEATGRRRLRGRLLVLTVVVAVLAVAAVVLAGIAFSKQRSAAEASSAADEASAAAERSLPAVLSYDYQNLRADRARAVPFLSSSYRSEYTKTFDQLIESTTEGQPGPAEKAQAVVKATVENVGVEPGAEPDRVRLVVFLNQSTSKAGGDPTFSLNRLGVSMVRSGNSWLVDNIVSY